MAGLSYDYNWHPISVNFNDVNNMMSGASNTLSHVGDIFSKLRDSIIAQENAKAEMDFKNRQLEQADRQFMLGQELDWKKHRETIAQKKDEALGKNLIDLWKLQRQEARDAERNKLLSEGIYGKGLNQRATNSAATQLLAARDRALNEYGQLSSRIDAREAGVNKPIQDLKELNEQIALVSKQVDENKHLDNKVYNKNNEYNTSSMLDIMMGLQPSSNNVQGQNVDYKQVSYKTPTEEELAVNPNATKSFAFKANNMSVDDARAALMSDRQTLDALKKRKKELEDYLGSNEYVKIKANATESTKDIRKRAERLARFANDMTDPFKMTAATQKLVTQMFGRSFDKAGMPADIVERMREISKTADASTLAAFSGSKKSKSGSNSSNGFDLDKFVKAFKGASGIDFGDIDNEDRLKMLEQAAALQQLGYSSDDSGTVFGAAATRYPLHSLVPSMLNDMVAPNTDDVSATIQMLLPYLQNNNSQD